MVWKLSSSFRKLLLPPKSSFEKREKKSEKETLRDWIFTPAFNSFSSNDHSIPWKLSFFPSSTKNRETQPNLFRFAWLKIIAEEKSKKKKRKASRIVAGIYRREGWIEGRRKWKTHMCRQKLASSRYWFLLLLQREAALGRNFEFPFNRGKACEDKGRKG